MKVVEAERYGERRWSPDESRARVSGECARSGEGSRVSRKCRAGRSALQCHIQFAGRRTSYPSDSERRWVAPDVDRVSEREDAGCPRCGDAESRVQLPVSLQGSELLPIGHLGYEAGVGQATRSGVAKPLDLNQVLPGSTPGVPTK